MQLRNFSSRTNIHLSGTNVRKVDFSYAHTEVFCLQNKLVVPQSFYNPATQNLMQSSLMTPHNLRRKMKKQSQHIHPLIDASINAQSLTANHVARKIYEMKMYIEINTIYDIHLTKDDLVLREIIIVVCRSSI